VSYTGNTTEFTPDYTGTVNIDKTVHVSGGQFVFHADTHYQGNTYLDATMNRQNFQAGYWLVDSRVGYEFNLRADHSTAGIYAFAKNLTDKAYLVFARQASGANTGLYGDPRMYGLELRTKF
jgi:iron complex outermembrane receptor protein